MRIAVLSDIHDNVWNLAAALEAVADAGRWPSIPVRSWARPSQPGRKTDAASTFMVYDTATGEAAGFEVSGAGVVPISPYEA